MNEVSFQPSAEAATPPGPGPTNPPRRILVVDDEPCLRQLMTLVLTDSGYDVDTAEDGVAAWEALQAKPYDLLITDHYMPGITGLELLKNLRSARMALPVVMVAGILPARDLAGNPALQLAAAVLKPFTVDVLLETVKEALHEAPPTACV